MCYIEQEDQYHCYMKTGSFALPCGPTEYFYPSWFFCYLSASTELAYNQSRLLLSYAKLWRCSLNTFSYWHGLYQMCNVASSQGFLCVFVFLCFCEHRYLSKFSFSITSETFSCYWLALINFIYPQNPGPYIEPINYIYNIKQESIV